MIALNIVLMLAVVVGIVSLLAWAIFSDRNSQRATGGELHPSEAPLHRNLELPHELKAHSVRAHVPSGSRRRVRGSSVA